MKRLVIVIFIIFASFLTFSLYRTFAYDTSVVEETPSTTDLEYTFKIGNSSIKQITIDSGETKYYDVVLNNPNPAKISYGVYYEMVSPSIKPDNFSIEYTSKSTGESTGKVDKERNITLNLVVTNTSSSSVIVKLGTIVGYVNGGALKLNSNQQVIPKEPLPKATEVIKSLDDGTTGDSGSGVYKVHHDAIPANSSATGEIIEATDDYRYYGKNPNNYIFLDKNSDNTCEDRHLYRIIGSMREDSDNIYKLKVIKATPLTDGTTSAFSWDCTGTSSNSKLLAVPIGTVCNRSKHIWSGNEGDATIMQLLNGIWLTGGAGEYYNDDTNPINIDFSNYSPTKKAQTIINKKSTYYLGVYSTIKELTQDAYNIERGTSTINGSFSFWKGTIGLLYMSDYGYISGEKCSTKIYLSEYNKTCKSNNWLYNNESLFSINSYNGNNFGLAGSDNHGNLSYNIWTYSPSQILPTFYLKSEVVITGGTGEETNPYTVSIE